MKVLLSKMTQPVLTNRLIWKTMHGRIWVNEHSYNTGMVQILIFQKNKKNKQKTGK